MTDVEQLTIDAITKVGKQVNNLSNNLSANTAKIELLEKTVAKLNEEVRTGNGRPSLVSRMRSFEESNERAQTKGGKVELAKFRGGKEVWAAIIIACGAAFASVVSLFKS